MTDDGTTEPMLHAYPSQGLTLSYVDWGNVQAPLLLLVHGMRDHARSWDWVARELSRQWHVVAPDLRGHGDSQWSPDGAYLNAYHVIDLADLIDLLRQEPEVVTIIGHSFGGNIGLRYAAMFPEHVRKLVAIEGLGPSPDLQRESAKIGQVQRMRDFASRRRAALARPPKRFATLDETVTRMAAANPHLTADQARHLAVHGVRRHPDGYGWKFDPLVGIFPAEEFGSDTPALWREISAPTLLCYGTESWARNPEEDGRAAAFPDQRTVLFEKAGHWLHHDQFDAFMTALYDFV